MSIHDIRLELATYGLKLHLDEKVPPRLPDEIWLRIFAYLDLESIIRVRTIDKRLCALTEDVANKVQTMLLKTIFEFPASQNQQPAGPAAMRVLGSHLFVPDDQMIRQISLKTHKEEAQLPLDETTHDEPASEAEGHHDLINHLFETETFLVRQPYSEQVNQAQYDEINYTPDDIELYDLARKKTIKRFKIDSEEKWFKKAILLSTLLFGLTHNGSIVVWNLCTSQRIRHITIPDKTFVDMTASHCQLIIKSYTSEERLSQPNEIIPAQNSIHLLHLNLQEMSSSQ